MSVLVMSAVWKYSSYTQEKLLLLLALADWSNDDGYCWPSMGKIAEKSRITERGAQKIMRSFIESGVVEIVESGGGRGNTPMYRIKGEPHSGFNFLKGEQEPPKRVNLETKKGERRSSAIRNEPSVEPSVEPPPTLFAEANGSVGAQETEDLKRVWEYYKQKVNKTFSVLTPDRRKKFLARYHDALKLAKGDRGRVVEWFEIAIDELAADDFHNARGEYKGRKTYNDFEYIVRSWKDFEKWLNRSNGQ